MMEIANSNLSRLLELTSRKQFVSGKSQPQVIACVLRANDGEVATTSLVRDGKTSRSRFSAALDCEAVHINIPIPDIERLQGVLKAHGPEVKLTYDTSGPTGKLKVKSKSKQTTLIAEEGGLAFPHSPETIGQWEEKSQSRAEQVTDSGYQMANGDTREPFFCYEFEDAGELSDALSCDNINNQRLNRYHFFVDHESDTFIVKVGEELKGATEILLGNGPGLPDTSFDASFEGGLENVLSQYRGRPISLEFIDFRPEGQGIRLVLRLPDGDWVFQAGVL